MNDPADVDTPPAVALRGIYKRFGDVVAVDNLDLDIASGEFFALLGPSGCGKTTTLRMIAGLEFPSEGSLKIDGDEVGTLPPNKRPVNTVFQNYALFPHLSVRDNVGFGLKMHKVVKSEIHKRVGDALDLVRLSGYGDRKPNQLSGGQQQRVALARALVNRPKVLLLDEPLAALDLKLRQGMQDELKSIQRELGITFVFVTHDQHEALTMSDRIGVMESGKLLQIGGPEDIYEHPATRFVADFIGRTNFLPGAVADSDTVVLQNGQRIRATNDLDIGTEVSVSIRPERLMCEAIDSPEAERRALEQPDHGASMSGVIKQVTYLGESISYQVGFDWLELEVRHENQPTQGRFGVGDAVTVSWHPDAAAVVPGDAPTPDPESVEVDV